MGGIGAHQGAGPGKRAHVFLPALEVGHASGAEESHELGVNAEKAPRTYGTMLTFGLNRV